MKHRIGRSIAFLLTSVLLFTSSMGEYTTFAYEDVQAEAELGDTDVTFPDTEETADEQDDTADTTDGSDITLEEDTTDIDRDTIATDDDAIADTESDELEDISGKKEDIIEADTDPDDNTAEPQKTVTVTFDYNGGNVYGEKSYKEEFNAGATVFLSSVPAEREGYELKGWSKTKNGSIDYYPNEDFIVTEDTTLYCVWEKLVTVVFHANGGLFPEGANVQGGYCKLSEDRTCLTVYVKKGGNIYFLNAIPEHKNKSLLGWSKDKKATQPDDGSNRESLECVIKDADYYAVWTNSCKVTFISSGNLYFKNENNKYVQKLAVFVPKGEILSNYCPAVHIKKGSKYPIINSDKLSMSKNPQKGEGFDPAGFIVKENVTLYAAPEEIKVTWNANGGKIDGKSKVTRTNLVYEDDMGSNDIYTPPVPVRSGYSLVGWSKTKNASGLVTDFHTVENTTYYAIWEKGACKITVKAGDGEFAWVDEGSGEISKDKKTYTTYVEKGASLASVDFYAVNKESGEGSSGAVSLTNGGEEIPKNTYYPGENTTLYVKWPDNLNLSVTYDANGGVFENGNKTNSLDYSKGGVFKESEYEAVRDGYIFTGFYTKQKGGKKLIPGRSKITKNMTAYAQWEKGVKLTFDGNGGRFANTSVFKLTNSLVLKKGTVIPDLNVYAPVYAAENRKGFAGWSKKKNGKVIDPTNYKVTGKQTLYAVWKKGEDIGHGRIEMSATELTYNGKEKKPKFTVYDRNGKKLKKNDYKVTWSDNTVLGCSYVIVSGKGKYTGQILQYFNINYDKKSNVTKVNGGAKKLTVKYKKAKNAAKYNVYAVNQNTGEVYQTTSKKQAADIKNLPKGSYLVYVKPVAVYKVKGKAKRTCEMESSRAGKIIRHVIR